MTTFRKWRVRDAVSTNAGGLARSYELLPAMNSGILRTTETEAFGGGEGGLTRDQS